MTSALATEPSELIRVLIVDDFEDIRFLLRAQLEHDGRFEVVGEGSDGQEGVDLVARLQPDVVVLDLAMPRMDGLQALGLIKDQWPETRIVVLSAFDQASFKDSAIIARAERYVEKGMRMNLPDVVASVMSEPPV